MRLHEHGVEGRGVVDAHVHAHRWRMWRTQLELPTMVLPIVVGTI